MPENDPGDYGSGPMAFNLGDLAAALAAAQSTFPPIKRERSVTVQTKTGGSYSFSYAPLDAIFEAIRQPLASNGLAVSQLLDGSHLVTLLLHKSGGFLTSRVPIASGTGIQEFGSAITYLRRYTLQAILGITADEDDDGNAAAGNRIKDRAPKASSAPPAAQPVRPMVPGSDEPEALGIYVGSGKLGVNPNPPADGLIRTGPDGAVMVLTFTPDGGRKMQVAVRGTLAADLYDAGQGKLQGLPCTVEGDLFRHKWRKDGKEMPAYERLDLRRITTGDWSLPEPAPVDDDQAELDALLP